MLNPNYEITSYDSNQALLKWTVSLITDVSYVFVNGCKILENFSSGSINRHVLIPFRKDRCITVEVHDFDTTDNSCETINEVSNKQPIIAWLAVANALRYKIYANNKLLHTLPAQENIVNYHKKIVFPEFYGKIWTWHFFTVTSVDLYGNESILKYFPYFVYDLPPIVKEIAVSDGSGAGLYNFTITL